MECEVCGVWGVRCEGCESVRGVGCEVCEV